MLDIQNTQQLILLLLTILLVLIALRCAFQFLRWLIGNRCFQKLMRRLQSKAYPHPATANGKDLNATTIQNLNAINHPGSDLERAQSQIYSVAGKCKDLPVRVFPITLPNVHIITAMIYYRCCRGFRCDYDNAGEHSLSGGKQYHAHNGYDGDRIRIR